jgi:hypothetical protein
LGHELRRPEADYLRDSIYELRAKRPDIPAQEIDLALKRKEAFTKDPVAHSHEEQ